MSDPNEMAFPVMDVSAVPNGQVQLGLTKREYFAGLVMQGICSESSCRRALSASALARFSVEYADALISELSKVKI